MATPKIALILGTTYTGKSYAAGYLASRIRRDFVVIVHLRRDPSYFFHVDPRRTRFVSVSTGQHLVSPNFLRATRAAGYRYLWLSVYDLSPDETKEFLTSLVRAVKEVGNLALFIDEAHIFCARHQVPPAFIGFVRGARHYGVDVVLVTQRLKDIDVGIRCVLTHLVLFRTVEAMDIEVLAGELGVGTDAEELRHYPDGVHLFVNRRTGEKRRKRRI